MSNAIRKIMTSIHHIVFSDHYGSYLCYSTNHDSNHIYATAPIMMTAICFGLNGIHLYKAEEIADLIP